MQSAILDEAAIRFSSACYQQLSFGRCVEKSYEIACDSIALNIKLDDQKRI